MQRYFDKEYISLTLSIWEQSGVFKNEAPYIIPALLILTVPQHTAATTWFDSLLKRVVE